ncbi:MAG: type II toxin-antitoxin system RelB/DinJ family antitoxin [Candidatus Nomurabacteria bacterium]|nr:type II toxin-antitoxin system RelB/DinJ family antitoxin [Candidatus Nomurabacteria bacterium]USN87466.1 MAG: type II toxin-antitoxin system RelB/DinJ family antitoxin [Candidatus Nomurabacteria bacterium]
MNTHTILNVKTDKALKKEAKKVAEELGVPLSTVINAFLKQFVRDKEITLSASNHRPAPYLESILEQAQKEYEAGDFVGPFKSEKDLITHLKSL